MHCHMYSHVVPPVWRWNSLSVLFLVSSCSRQEEGNLVGLCQILDLPAHTVFRLCCGRTARWGSNGRREKRQLALCLTHEAVRPQHYHRGSNCTLFASTELNQSLAYCHRRERSQIARSVPEGREAWCAWHARQEPHQFCSDSCWQKTWTNPPRF